MPPSTAVVLVLAPWYVGLLQCLSNFLASMRIERCCWSVDCKALQHFINDLYQPSTHFQYKIFEGIQRKGIDSKNIRDSFGKSNCKACGVYRHRYMCVFKLGSKYARSN